MSPLLASHLSAENNMDGIVWFAVLVPRILVMVLVVFRVHVPFVFCEGIRILLLLLVIYFALEVIDELVTVTQGVVTLGVRRAGLVKELI